MEINNHIVAFLSLEDFVQDVIAVDDLARVEVITRTLPGNPSGMQEWFVIVTSRLADGTIGMTSIRVGRVLEIFARHELYHSENAKWAGDLVRQYLESQGFVVGPGIWQPGAVMDNIVMADCDLWHFDEDKRLVANDIRPATGLTDHVRYQVPDTPFFGD